MSDMRAQPHGTGEEGKSLWESGLALMAEYVEGRGAECTQSQVLLIIRVSDTVLSTY